MNNTGISSLNRGGGNNLNLIIVSSLVEMRNIIFSSDLNGNITPWDVNVWHFATNHFNWFQNNSTTLATVGEITSSYLSDSMFSKNTAVKNVSQPCVFKPIIEFRE